MERYVIFALLVLPELIFIAALLYIWYKNRPSKRMKQVGMWLHRAGLLKYALILWMIDRARHSHSLKANHFWWWAIKKTRFLAARRVA